MTELIVDVGVRDRNRVVGSTLVSDVRSGMRREDGRWVYMCSDANEDQVKQTCDICTHTNHDSLRIGEDETTGDA